MRRRHPGPVAAAVLLAGAAGGCGYTMGVDGVGGGARTVAVAVVENHTFRQRLEIPLTRAIVAALTEYGGLQPVARSAADTVLEVTLDEVHGLRLIGDGRLPVREGALDFRATVTLRDRRSGETLRQRVVVDRAEYRTTLGHPVLEPSRADREDEVSAAAEAVSDLARKIVLALEADF